MTILINSKTGREIRPAEVVSSDEKGIIVSNANCRKFMPSREIKQKREFEDGYYFTQEKVPELQEVIRTEKFHDSRNEITTSYREKAEYRFGLKNILFANKTFFKDSAISSKEIDVSDAKYITLDVIEESSYMSSVEYYIIDGTREVPLLPEGHDFVEMERLFYDCNTRFLVDNSVEEPVLYQDGVVCSRDYLSLSFNDFEEHEYALSYVPGGNVHSYFPENDKVKVKMIIRNYTDIFSPKVISGVTVKKYGVKPEWI